MSLSKMKKWKVWAGFDRRTAWAFLGVDFVLIAISIGFGLAVAMRMTPAWPDLWNVGRDWSAGEIFNYIKWLLLMSVCFHAWQKTKRLLLFMVGLFFIIVVSDDALQLHERFGAVVASGLGLPELLGPAAFQLGELAVWASLGFVSAILLFMGWRKADAELKARVTPMAWLFAGVIFCAVGVDTIHSMVPEKTILGGVVLIMEDGGEMVFISALVSYTIGTFGPRALLSNARVEQGAVVAPGDEPASLHL